MGSSLRTSERSRSKTGVSEEIEDGVEIDAVGERTIAPHELAEVLLFVPRLQRVALDEPVGLVAREPGLDEREQ